METAEIEGYLLEFDADATAAVYASLSLPEPERCGCWYCKNWVAGGRDLVPQGVRVLLRSLGVPLDGETEVWEVPGTTLGHGYGGWYTIIGSVRRAPRGDAMHFVIDQWSLSFSATASYPVPAFAGHPVFELSFFVDNIPSFLPGAP